MYCFHADKKDRDGLDQPKRTFQLTPDVDPDSSCLCTLFVYHRSSLDTVPNRWRLLEDADSYSIGRNHATKQELPGFLIFFEFILQTLDPISHFCPL